MKKLSLVLACLAFTVVSVYAQEAGEGTKTNDEVPRYENFAVGAFFNNVYAVGGWSNYAITNLGGGLDVEYTIPPFLPLNMDLGASLHLDFGHTIPKSGTTLKSHNDIRTGLGVWLRLPFALGSQNFAFQPELQLGLGINNVESQNGASAEGWYLDMVYMITPALRYVVPVEALNSLEIEAAPVISISPENSGYTVGNIGFRLGAVFHINDFVNSRKNSSKDKKEAAVKGASSEGSDEGTAEGTAKGEDLEEATAEDSVEDSAENSKASSKAKAKSKDARAKKMLKELDKLKAKPELMLGVNPKALQNFTPDGDGENDTISFAPVTSYLTKPAENWSLIIIDPAGNNFKNWSGKGNPPEIITWDGKSNEGEKVYSYNNYKALLQVSPSEKDKEYLGLDETTASVEGSVEIKTGLVLNKSEWKIVMTSIPFDANAATFKLLDRAQKDKLEKALNEVCEKVEDLGENVTVTVTGYENNVSGTEKENLEELIPLSQKRAETMAAMLVQRGLSKDKVKAVGLGGAEPVASREDQANCWKNCRIEFIIKN